MSFSLHADAAPQAEPVRWALSRLEAALLARGLTRSNGAADIEVHAMDAANPEAQRRAEADGIALPTHPEAFALLRAGQQVTAIGGGVRGLAYALAELADRVEHAEDGPLLEDGFPLAEAPATRVRAMCRAFISEVEDKPWLYDTTQWIAYLDMLVANRFNRFSLSLGMGYDYPYHNELISDVYLHFPYPYLLALPGYDVRVEGLPESERAANLDALRFIGREAARRGLDFQLALWTQRYDFHNAPNANYAIGGIAEGVLGPYCRDAVAMLLKEVPEITGLTFRIHVEGGISEGDYDFWRLVFDGVRQAGRPVVIDMHAKGLDETTLNLGLESGMPVCVSPKYLAEHVGLAYHPSAIREREYPPAEAMTNREKLSVGSRRFMRQSYGDMLPADKNWQVVFRVWPGTQRVLAWGDPELAAGYGRSASFAGADGIEWMEPMTFKGRQGTGVRGGRLGTSDPSLATRYDWEKHLLQFRLLGRLSFAPDSAPDGWRRDLRRRCGDAAEPLEAALGAASKILPLVLQAHGPSIANNNYWPEVYTNIAVVGDNRIRPVGEDMDHPVRFGTAPTFDGQIFANAHDYVAELVRGAPTRRYTPLDVADWLEGCAERAEVALARARSCVDSARPAARALLTDAAILAALGRFFAGKFRAACWAELYLLTFGQMVKGRMLGHLRQAREGWRMAAKLSEDTYPPDITFGPGPHLRGSWRVRDAEVQRELEDVTAFRFRDDPEPVLDAAIAAAATAALLARRPVRAATAPEAPATFQRGEAVTVRLSTPDDGAHVLHFRHVNQAERWRTLEMTAGNGAAEATIPGEYTDSRYHLQFYVSSVAADGTVTMAPGLGVSLANAPYVLVAQQK